MCRCLVLSVVPGMFGRLCLSYPADGENTEHDESREELAKRPIHRKHFSKMTEARYEQMLQNSADATDATTVVDGRRRWQRLSSRLDAT